ncbi:MAG: hypothetical protein R3C11_01335 [Planctomycetaceae bacterium]
MSKYSKLNQCILENVFKPKRDLSLTACILDTFDQECQLRVNKHNSGEVAQLRAATRLADRVRSLKLIRLTHSTVLACLEDGFEPLMPRSATEIERHISLLFGKTLHRLERIQYPLAQRILVALSTGYHLDDIQRSIRFDKPDWNPPDIVRELGHSILHFWIGHLEIKSETQPELPHSMSPLSFAGRVQSCQGVNDSFCEFKKLAKR